MLLNNTSELAYAIVDNSSKNGFLAWQKLVRSYALVTPQTQRKLLKGLLYPTPAKNLLDLEKKEEEWESKLRKYDEHVGKESSREVFRKFYKAVSV